MDNTIKKMAINISQCHKIFYDKQVFYLIFQQPPCWQLSLQQVVKFIY